MQVETQIEELIKEWQSKTSRPVDKEWVLSNLKSDPDALKEIQDLIDDL